MTDYVRALKSDRWKNWIIFGLLALIVVLFWTNTLAESTKKGFYWLAGFVVLVGTIMYFLSTQRKLDIYKIAQDVLDKEYNYTGKRINIADLNMDILDAETFVIGFESGGYLISYKWDRVNNNLIARLSKKIDEVKNESNQREITREIAKRNVDRMNERKLAEQKGFELIDPSDPGGAA